MRLSLINPWSVAPHQQSAKLLRSLHADMHALASGSRAGSAAQDPAATVVGSNLEAKLVSSAQAHSNAKVGQSMLMVAEAAYEQITSALIRMRELAVGAANGTLVDEQRAQLDTEFSQLGSQIDQISGRAEFNGIPLLSMAQTLTFQVGVYARNPDKLDISLAEINTNATLNVAGSSIGTAPDARDALDTVDGALEAVNEERSRIGASMRRLELSEDAAWSALDSYTVSHSHVVDANMAEKASQVVMQRIRLDALTAMSAQASAMSNLPLRLFT